MIIRFWLPLAALLGLGMAVQAAENPALRPGVRAAVASINAEVAQYKKETRSVEGLSLEGSEATFFSEGGALRKVSAKIYGETFNAGAELYYQGGVIVFAYQKLNRYDTQIGMQPPPKVVGSEEKRYYFSGGKLAALRIGQEDIAAPDVRWREGEEEIDEFISQMEAAFRKSE